MKAKFTYKLEHPGYEAEGEASITPEQYGAICALIEGRPPAAGASSEAVNVALNLVDTLYDLNQQQAPIGQRIDAKIALKRAILALATPTVPAPFLQPTREEVEAEDVSDLDPAPLLAKLDALRQGTPAPASVPAVSEPVAWRHSRTLMLYDSEDDVPLADGDEWAEPLYLIPALRRGAPK